MELGVFTRVYQDLPPEDAFARCARLGLRKLEVVANTGSLHFDLNRALEIDFFEKTQNLLQANGQEIEAITLHRDAQLVLGPHGEATQRFYKGSAEEQIRYGEWRVRRAARVAKEYGIKKVVGYLGCGDFSQWYPWPSADGWARQIETLKRRWVPILEEYERLGVRFAHEVGPQQIAYNLETAEEVLSALDSDSFGLCLDPSNLYLAGVDPVVCIERVGERILHVHGKDAELTHHAAASGWMAHGRLDRPDRGFRFRIPGWGDLHWKKILTALKISGYDGMISIEVEDPTVDGTEALEKSVAYLQPLLFR